MNRSEENSVPIPSSAPFLSMGQKWLFWFGAWALVIASTCVINPELIAAELIFPAGLFGWTFNSDNLISQIHALEILVVIGWIIYALITIFLIRAKSKLRFFSLYATFCLLLAFNVLGCHHLVYELSASSGIH